MLRHFRENVKTIEGYAELNFEDASFITSRYILKKDHFMTAAMDINDSIKWKRIQVSLKKTDLSAQPGLFAKKPQHKNDWTPLPFIPNSTDIPLLKDSHKSIENEIVKCKTNDWQQ